MIWSEFQSARAYRVYVIDCIRQCTGIGIDRACEAILSVRLPSLRRVLASHRPCPVPGPNPSVEVVETTDSCQSCSGRFGEESLLRVIERPRSDSGRKRLMLTVWSYFPLAGSDSLKF